MLLSFGVRKILRIFEANLIICLIFSYGNCVLSAQHDIIFECEDIVDKSEFLLPYKNKMRTCLKKINIKIK